MASIKAGKMLQSLTALTQIYCAGDSTANLNLTKSRILTSSDYYLLQVEVDDDEQSNSSDSEVSDEDVDMDVGMDIGNAVQSIE